MALETTYAYDFPDLFKRNMIDIWNEHRARFPNSVHPPDSEICTNQVNKLKLMCGSCHFYRWILKLAANLFLFLFFAEFKRTTNWSAIFWNHSTFPLSWRCPKIHFTATLKIQKSFNIWHQFQQSLGQIKLVHMTWFMHKKYISRLY